MSRAWVQDLRGTGGGFCCPVPPCRNPGSHRSHREGTAQLCPKTCLAAEHFKGFHSSPGAGDLGAVPGSGTSLQVPEG